MAYRDYIHEIQTIKRHGLGDLDTWMRAYLRQNYPGVRLPTGVKDSPLRYARVEQGRWLIDCPDCNGATFGDPDDQRFLCPDCLNAASGGTWLAVVFPDDVEAVEQELLKRPIANRNYLPTETVEDLQIENLAFGVADVTEPTVETAFARKGFPAAGIDVQAMVEEMKRRGGKD